MKKIITLLALTAMLAGCTDSTKYGPCIGFMKEENPKVEYELSTQNLVVAVLLSETIVVPVIVAANQYKCPARVKEVK